MKIFNPFISGEKKTEKMLTTGIKSKKIQFSIDIFSGFSGAARYWVISNLLSSRAASSSVGFFLSGMASYRAIVAAAVMPVRPQAGQGADTGLVFAAAATTGAPQEEHTLA